MMHWETVTPLLREVLEKCIVADVFDDFRLVGGTSLSLQLGHRVSVDIDLFTDAEYRSKDFMVIEEFLRGTFPYADTNTTGIIGMGASYFVGYSDRDAIKMDIYYTDTFIRPAVEEDGIRMASVGDIIAMKLDIIGRGGRKKDFWDLHECHRHYDIPTMINLYLERYPYNYTQEELRKGLVEFTIADDDFDPLCLLSKHWELVKLDFVQWISRE